MKEIPIIFSTDMVKGILDGTKNLTFRVIKPQPKLTISDEQYKKNIRLLMDGGNKVCPYGQVGDRLWVRETFDYILGDEGDYLIYKAKEDDYKWFQGRKKDGSKITWKPSIHMPRWASRITLERSEPAYVKRTLDITEEEAKLCGFESLEDYHCYWNHLNKKRGFPFADNVWVWGVPFGAMSYRGK